MSEIFQKMEEQSWKYIQFYLRPRNILEKSIYLFFNIKGAPLMVEDTPVLMSLAFSQIKLRRRTGLLWSLLLVVLILAFTFIGGMVTGGNPLISYSQYMSGVWKQREERFYMKYSGNWETYRKKLTELIRSLFSMQGIGNV